MKGMGRMGDCDGMVAILAKTRSFPLISVHLSRALGWDLGVNGGGEGGFGGDIHGFGGHLRGFGGAAMGSSVFGCGLWDGSRDGGGTDLRRQLTMVKMGEGWRKGGNVIGSGKGHRGDCLENRTALRRDGNSSDLLSHFHIQPVIPAPVSGTGQALSGNPENPRPTHGCPSAGYLDTGIRPWRTSPTFAGMTVCVPDRHLDSELLPERQGNRVLMSDSAAIGIGSNGR